MLLPERLSDMAVPTHRFVRQKDIKQLLGPELIPLDRLVVWSQKGRLMIQMMKRAKSLVAIHTALAFIPVGNNVPHQAVLWVGLDLLQALLTAVLAFGPAGALIQTKSWFTDESPDSRFSSGHIHSFFRERLRAGDETLSTVHEIGSQHWEHAEKNRAYQHSHHSNSKKG
jgi:hypothetical protein